MSHTKVHATTTRRHIEHASMPQLRPIVMALFAAFPVLASAQARVALPPPPIFRVPVPVSIPGWRVSGTGGPPPVPVLNRAGGNDEVINQTSQNAVYNWASFDIGAASSVTFNFPSSAGSALNRVTGSTTPSQIFGRLSSQYTNPTAGGAPLVGGSIYLINANGILFGRGAQVNTGALIASTLNLTDADFNSGLTNSITSTSASFFRDGSGVLDSNNFVQVDPGAQITTPEGGRVFLFAKTVQNGGTISTPGGQTALAAGDQVYLNVPTAEVMYASEVNPSIPALRGLLVEVGEGSGSVANIAGGVIDTPRGNTTLVGMAVNQSGRITATTSVSENGSVMLLARGGATAGTSGGSTIFKRATTAGTLTLGAGSSIEIDPDTTPGADGKPATSDGNSVFTASRVELDGQTVQLQTGAAIVAHGGIVNIRSESTPFYEEAGSAALPFNYAAFDGNTNARLVIGDGVNIDVSGTTSATVSAARNFVTTDVLGATDLKDAPLQKDGPVFHSKISFDVRDGVPILGDTSSYQAAIQRTAEERLSKGGSINLSSTGAVVTSETSNLNVSGGQVNYTAAMVTPSQLVGKDGKIYSFNDAPADTPYASIIGASGAPTIDRWGIVPQYLPAQTLKGQLAQGYVDGQAGGTLRIVAPLSVLDGHVQAQTIAGVRQTSGLDPLAVSSRLELGARTNGATAFGSTDYVSSGLGDLDITKDPGSLGSGFWSDPLNRALPDASRVAASILNASGLGQVIVTSDGSISQQAGADISLAPGSTVDLAAGGANGISIAANFTSAGGTFNAETRDVPTSAVHPAATSGNITLEAGNTIDVSAAWVNRAIDGATATAATTGGSVTLSSGRGLDVQDATRIDVSGGATVGVDGKVAGTAAGSINLQSNMIRSTDTDPASPVHIGAALVGNSLNGGGTLAISADSITIGSQPQPRGINDGQAVGSLVLSDQFFTNGAFTNYDISAVRSLVVQPGVTLQPQASNWILTADAVNEPTGAKPSSFMSQGQLPDSQRKPVNLALSAASRVGNAFGDLTIGAGASIVTDPLGSMSLSAGLNLDLEGRITAHGGDVSLNLVGTAQSSTPTAGSLTMGARSLIDVSGTTVLQPQTGLLPTGQVLAGGDVKIGVSGSASLTPIVLRPGSVIDADGATDTLGVTTTTAGGGTAQTMQSIATEGGSVTIASQTGGATLAGTMHANGGDASVSGGAFNLSQISTPDQTSTIVLQQAQVDSTSTVANSVVVSATDLSSGFSDASLQSQNVIRFSGDISLAMSGNLTLDAPVLTASPQSRDISLSAGSTLQTGSSYQQNLSPAGAIGGSTKLSLKSGLVGLFGQQVLQGFKSVDLTSQSELRLQSLIGAGPVQGDFGVQGDLTINAPQIAPTTNTQFTIDAPGQRVLMTGGDRNAAAPMSAGGSLTINARDITTIDPNDASSYAVLRAPFGSLTLNATDRIDIGAGSLLSVSGAGLTVPYGTTTGGKTWSYDGTAVTAPPEKTINLNAPGKAVNVAAGSTLDLSGGGDLLALEFIPGGGGSKDIFAGAAGGAFAIIPGSSSYAPHDADLLTLTDASGARANGSIGQDITFGPGGPVPAGTYVVLPARYAVLPGAYLVTPTASSAPLALGATVPQQDGTTLVGGRYSEAGTSFGSSLPQTFRIASSTLAQTHSEIDQANANTYFSNTAAAAGTTVPALPTDAGRLNIAADQLVLKGSTDFTLPQTTDATGKTVTVGRGGELDIAASNIQVGGSTGGSTGNQTGVLSLSAADLNATGASLVVLGGQRSGDAGDGVDVTASNVVIDNAASPLKLNDLVLVATNKVELKAGSDIEAPAAGAATSAAPTLSLTGDGALLRVSSDAGATSVRTGAQQSAGTLVIGAGATLTGGAITAEATQSSTLAGDANFNASAITLGANRIAAGQTDPSAIGAGTLVMTPSLIAQVGKALSLTLRSFDGLDLYGSTTLGGASVHSLTLDTGTIRVIGDGASSTIEAGGVKLTNTSDSSSVAISGSGQLLIKASAADASAGTGQVVIGPGSLAVAGASKVAVNAAHEVVLGDQSSFAAAGDIAIDAAALQAAKGASATITAGDGFTLASSAKTAASGAGLGAHVEIDAASIDQAGQLLLPSGQLTLNASGAATGTASNAIHFASGSLTDLSGRSSNFDGVTVSTGGGALALNAPSGNIALDAGATLDVSGAATGGQAGSIGISAPTGTVALQGSLRATAAQGQTGGSLSVDSAGALDLAALAATINAAPRNFGESLDLRNRIGDQQLAAGTSLSARSISISTDTGALSVAGKLDASGASGTTITLAGGAGLNIDAGADIGAHSNGPVGAQVQLMSGNLQAQADGSFAGSNGPVQLNGGTIDTSAASGGTDGSVLVRAQRNAAGTDVMVGGSGQTVVRGASKVEVEAVKQYSSTTINTALITKINTDDATLGGTGGANAAQVRTRLANLLGQPANAVQLRAGVEVDSTGDLTVVGNPTNGGWNLTQFAANGTATAQPTGSPIDLTLRAQGNLNVSASISDGFIPSGTVPTTAAAASRIVAASTIANIGGSPAQGARIRLIGGADASAADVMATSASPDAGDVVIGAAGKSVLVRTTTGDIDIAAGRDVVLLNPQAAVYTTGTPVATADLTNAGYVGNKLSVTAYLRSGTTSQNPFLSGGGSLSVNAGRDIVGVDPSTGPQQYATEWAWRALDLTGASSATAQPMWWNRYDQFQQGFATFGGGNVTASAQRDVVNGDFSAATSGFVARDAAGNPAGTKQFGGGDVSVQAGRDVVAGFVLAAGANGNVQAGRDITASTDDGSFALQVLHGNTDLRIGALDNIDLGQVTSFGLIQPTKQFGTTPDLYITGLAPNATLDVVADSGNLNYRASAPSDNGGINTALPRDGTSAVQDRIVPDVSTFAAPSGNLDVGTLLQTPSGTTSLNLLAGGDLHATGITVTGTALSAAVSTINNSDGDTLNQLTGNFDPTLAPIDTGTRSPMRLVAKDGDVVVSTGILTTTPLRVISGRDISFDPDHSPSSFAGITFQHQSDSELSLLQAGRDILFPATGRPIGADVQFYGPGNLVVLAGRNIDLSTSGGIEALGNRQNKNLPAESGTVTALAGVSLGTDYSQAIAWYFPLLGGTGIAGHAADLAADLAALQAGQPLPALGSSAATQFSALAVDDQIAQAKTLAGEATFNAAVLADARRRNADPAETLTQALADYAKLDSAARFSVASAALANAWSAAVPQAEQQQQVLAMASAGSTGSNSYLSALQQFVTSQGGTPGLTPDQALAAFSALAPERQLLFTNQVLISEVRKAGRKASALAGSERDAAYAPAYAAIDVVFPGSGAAGDISMGNSQIHTLQNSDLVLMAPHGNVDVGSLAAGGINQKPSNALGIVTGDGGNISVIVKGDVNVNQSRVFTVGKGDLMLWASDGNLDAGRGAKTVTGAPPPVFSLDSSGRFVIDTSGSFSGSGIAVLDASSTLDLYAPKGEINTGDAGIKSLGNAFLGAARFVGADNLSIAGVAVGAPPPALTGGDTAGLAAAAQSATSASPRINSDDSEDEKERKRRRRLNLILDFLGFGDGSSNQP